MFSNSYPIVGQAPNQDPYGLYISTYIDFLTSLVDGHGTYLRELFIFYIMNLLGPRALQVSTSAEYGISQIAFSPDNLHYLVSLLEHFSEKFAEAGEACPEPLSGDLTAYGILVGRFAEELNLIIQAWDESSQAFPAAIEGIVQRIVDLVARPARTVTTTSRSYAVMDIDFHDIDEKLANFDSTYNLIQQGLSNLWMEAYNAVLSSVGRFTLDQIEVLDEGMNRLNSIVVPGQAPQQGNRTPGKVPQTPQPKQKSGSPQSGSSDTQNPQLKPGYDKFKTKVLILGGIAIAASGLAMWLAIKP
jgi:hypothetical protein